MKGIARANEAKERSFPVRFSVVVALIVLMALATSCSGPTRGSPLNFAGAFGWGGYADTDMEFSEFFDSDHTIVARFMPQYPRAYAGPVVAENGMGVFFVGQQSHSGNDSSSAPDERLLLRVGSQQRTYDVHLDPGAWYHLAVTRSGNSFHVYLDGQHLAPEIVVNPTDGLLPAGNAKLRFGRITTGQTLYFDGNQRVPQFYGLIDDVAVFDRALSQAEISTLVGDYPRLDETLLGGSWGLVSAWTFDSTLPSGDSLPGAFDDPATLHSPADDGVSYEGVGELLPAQKVPASQLRDDTTDAEFLLPPFQQSTYHLPFTSGQAWHVTWGNNTTLSHFGFAAFTWDFILATTSNDSHLENAEPTSCDQPLYAMSSGTFTLVRDDEWTPTAKDQANALRVATAPDEFFSYGHIRNLSPTNAGWQVGDSVQAGDYVADVGTRQSNNCHLHMGVRSETVTIPIAFSDYEASDDQGQSWYYVERGVPQSGQWVRAVGSNTSPSIEITQPADGATFWYGGLGEPFSAEASDSEDGVSCCGISWISDVDGFLAAGASVNLALSPGTHLITARATDSEGAAATDSITVTAENVAPGITIVEPEEGDELFRDAPYVFNAQVNDPNEPLGDLCAGVTWSSSASEGPFAGCSPEVTFSSNGPRTLTATVTDEHGLESTDSVNVDVVDPPSSGPPLVTILQPSDGAGLEASNSYTLEGTASDPDGGAPLSFEWIVNDYFGIDRAIGSGSSINWTPEDDVPENCGGGTAQLRLEVTDPEGDVGQDSIEIYIFYPTC